ncbi:MAG TPA: ATP-binding protein [Pyrinomonadaceae bacterium]
MGIRGRLQIFAIVVAVPLAIAGVVALLGIWNISHVQLQESVKQQAELATIAFDRWARAQREPLTALAARVHPSGSGTPGKDDLRQVLKTRRHWIDVHIVSNDGRTIVGEPSPTEPLPSALVDYLLKQTRDQDFWMASDRTSTFSQPGLAVAVPTVEGGAVIARIDSSAISDLFRTSQFKDQPVIAIFDLDGHILFRGQTTGVPIDREVSGSPFFFGAGKEQAALIEIESPYDGVRRLYGVRASIMNSVVIVGIPTAVLYEPARQRFGMYLFLTLIIFACALVAGLIIARNITMPIRQLRETAQAFGADQLTARADVRDSGEIGELARAFNRMADKIVEREERLKELDRLKSEFVGNVSHELRTPLTTIKTLTHVLQRKMNGSELMREHLDTIAAECDRQIDLVSNLLDLSRIEAGGYKVDLVSVNPAEVLASCVSRLSHNAETRQQQLTLELPEELPAVRADRSALRRVLCNLIENAIKYTPDGGRISVGAFVETPDIVFYVRDNGSGIPGEEIPRIFDKFYRAGRENGNESCEYSEQWGVGLGLYIVRNVITQLGGSVEVSNAVDGGSLFEVRLPMWSAAAIGNDYGQ